MHHTQHLRKKHLALLVSAVSAIGAGALAPGAAYAQEEALEEVLITGSRIVRRDYSAPSPVMTVSNQQFENSSTSSIETVLNQLPQFVPGGTQFASSDQSSATNTPGAATLNLRGLGANRNLVLINGRRAQPVNATMVVDINTIPASAIANVEVITGGASSVYGPDAIAGVVNFKLKDDFEGLELDFHTGITERGDGEENRFSMLMGMNSADGRGNVMAGLDWTSRGEVLQRDRGFYRNGWVDPGNPSGNFMMPRAYFPNPGNGPSRAAVDSLFPSLPPGTVSTSNEIFFNNDGTPFVLQGGHGYKGPINCLDCGPFSLIRPLNNGNLDSFGREANNYLSTPMDRYSLFMRGTYDIADNVSAFMQANYSDIEVQTRGFIPPAITVWQAPAVPRDGRQLPAALNTLLDSRANPNAPWALFQVLDYNGPQELRNNNDVYQIMAGFEGTLMDGDWTWDAYASRGNTSTNVFYNNMPSLQRYQQLVYASNFGRVNNLTFPDAGRGYSMRCSTGLPVFQEFTPSQDCIDSIDTRLANRSNLSQDILEANLQGGLMELPAGQARFAVGATYRENIYSFVPGNPGEQLRDNPIGVFASARTGGRIDVREFYGELLVPVLSNLDVELGYRYSDFNTAGGQDTYKALFTWGVNDNITLRGGYQFATRAPNVAELFTAPTQEVVGFPDQDPCSVTTLSSWGNVPGNPNRAQVVNLCRALIGNNTSGFDTQEYSITGIAGPLGFHRQNPPFFPLEIALRQGNPNVGPEQADTWTIGAVVTEPFDLAGLTVTVDYYRIELSETINPLNVATVYNNCFNWDGASNPTYDVNNRWCRMVRRNPVTGDREEVDTPFDNLGQLKTEGIDLAVNWSHDIGPGVFNINSNINYLHEYRYQLAPGDALIDARGTFDQGGLFKYRMFTNFSYAWNDVNVGLTWRHLGSIDAEARAISPNTTIQGTGSYNIFNLNGSYNWNNYTLRAGIDNLLDEEPRILNANPGIDTNSNQTNPAFYDALGRRFYVGLKMSF